MPVFFLGQRDSVCAEKGGGVSGRPKGEEALRGLSFRMKDLIRAGCPGAKFLGAVFLGFWAFSASAAQAAPQVSAPIPLASPRIPADPAFTAWVKGFRKEAVAAGVKASVYDRAMSGLNPDPDVIAADRNQPEFSKPVWAYLESALSDKRVANGRAMLRAHEKALSRIEKAYGVDRRIVVAIWGLESAYGQFTGSLPVLRSLATLGYEGRREAFAKSQLIAALKIIQAGDTTPERMLGSWAGAMGQTQFIPTTYLIHAVDFDGDGRRDIWSSAEDALASTAHLLSRSGWKTGESWGYEVKLPSGFDYAQADRSIKRSVAQWRALGVRKADGGALPSRDDKQQAAILLPSGHRGPAFLVLPNFKAILAYNNSTSYALAVGLLSQRFSGGGHIVASWPKEERPLKRTEREALQRALTNAGYDTQGVDGIIGYNTRQAIRRYQKAHGLPADGHPNDRLLRQLNSR